MAGFDYNCGPGLCSEKKWRVSEGLNFVDWETAVIILF